MLKNEEYSSFLKHTHKKLDLRQRTPVREKNPIHLRTFSSSSDQFLSRFLKF